MSKVSANILLMGSIVATLGGISGYISLKKSARLVTFIGQTIFLVAVGV